MKNKQMLIVLLSIISISSVLKSQNGDYAVGLSYGFQDRELVDIWVGEPYNIWIDQISSNIFTGFCRYRVSPHFELGLFTEFETGKFDVIFLSEQKATRLGIGTTWLGKYPAEMIHFQLGGYFEYNVVSPENDNYDRETGIGYGIIVGPAVEYKNYGVAIHYHAGFSYYPTDGEPDEYSYANTKIKIKFYYIL